MITQVNLFDLMIGANWIFIKLKLERRMATSLLILLYILAAGYLVFWASLWIVHLMAIIYG